MTINDLKIGDRLVLGKYGVHNNQPYPVVWRKCNSNCDFITEKAIDVLCFDAAEQIIDDSSRGRRVWGGNQRYAVSNIFNFLNSESEEWYRPAHIADNPPSYSSHYGFLYNFNPGEIAVMNMHEYTVGGDSIKSRVRLPSGEDINCDEKTGFQIFKKIGLRPHPTADICDFRSCPDEYGTPYTETGYINFWLMDPVGPSTQRVRIISRSGCFAYLSAAKSAGVRPVCTLQPETIVSALDSGVFSVKISASDEQVFTDKEFFELLGMAQP